MTRGRAGFRGHSALMSSAEGEQSLGSKREPLGQRRSSARLQDGRAFQNLECRREWMIRALSDSSSDDGVSLHAASRIEAANRDRLESLIRYVARRALSLGRLEVEDDGEVRWTLERLVALVPHPREHGWTYFGSLVPAASIRDLVAPRAESVQPHARFSRMTWAELLRRMFGIDVSALPALR